MAFRNRIVRISQLIADELIGAFIATAAAGARWEIDNGPASGAVRGYTGDPAEVLPALFAMSSTPNPASGGQVLNTSLRGAAYGAGQSGYIDIFDDSVVGGGIDNVTGGKWSARDNLTPALATWEVRGTNAEIDLLASNGVRIGAAASSAVRGMRFGASSGVIATGTQFKDVVVPHGLGVMPTFYMITAAAGVDFSANMWALDATNLTVRVFHNASTVGAPTTIPFSWEVRV
jgi:hypothetical protein